MKRSGFKKKTGKPLKKSWLKKKSKVTTSSPFYPLKSK